MQKLRVTTNDTTLEALLTGKARLASYRNWPEVEVLELRDPFQDAAPCWRGGPNGSSYWIKNALATDGHTHYCSKCKLYWRHDAEHTRECQRDFHKLCPAHEDGERRNHAHTNHGGHPENGGFTMSLHIEGRRWFQRGPGTTYHSVRIWKDGVQIAHLPYQYGYGDGYLQTALDWLRANGHIPDICSRHDCSKTRAEHPPEHKAGHNFMPHYGTLYVRETLGGTYSVVDVTRKGDL